MLSCWTLVRGNGRMPKLCPERGPADPTTLTFAWAPSFPAVQIHRVQTPRSPFSCAKEAAAGNSRAGSKPTPSFSPVAETSQPTCLPEMCLALPEEPTLRARPEFLRPDARPPRQPIDFRSKPPDSEAHPPEEVRAPANDRAGRGGGGRQPHAARRGRGELRRNGRPAGAGGAHQACAHRGAKAAGRGF